MAFPTVAASSSGNSGQKRTSHTITLPTGIAAGNVLVLFFYANNATAGSTPSGWTSAASGLFWKLATGSESSTLTITTASSVGSAFACYRLTGASADPIGGITSATGTSNRPQAGTLNTGVSKDYLWVSAFGWDGNVSLTTPGYTDNLASSAWGNVNGAGVALTTKSLTASSSTDALGTLSSSTDWLAFNVAVRPPELRSGSFAETGGPGNQSFLWSEAHAGAFVQTGGGDLAATFSEGHDGGFAQTGSGDLAVTYTAVSTPPPLTTPSSPVIWIIDAPAWDGS